MGRRLRGTVLVLVLLLTGILLAPTGVTVVPGGGLSVVLASPGWVSPTGFDDPSGDWTDETLAYDENTGTYAYGTVPKGGWGGYVEFSIVAIDCDKIRAWLNEGSVNVNNWEVDVYYSAAWNNIFTGSEPLYGQYVEFPIGGTESVTGMRFRAYSTKADADGAQVYEVDFNEVVAAPDITNLPIELNFGVVGENSTNETGLTHFTVTNNSGGAVTITIKATDFTGGSGWTLSDTATPGVDTVGLKAGLEGGDYTIIVRKTETFNVLVSGLAPEGTQKWGLKLYTATEHSDGVQKSTTVTLTATLD